MKFQKPEVCLESRCISTTHHLHDNSGALLGQQLEPHHQAMVVDAALPYAGNHFGDATKYA